VKRAGSFGLLCLVLPLLPLSAQTISVGNAASGASQVAPGSLIRIFWSPLNDVGPPVSPTASVGLRPQGSEQVFGAQVINSQLSSEILAVVPDEVPLGPTDVLLTINTVSFPPATVSVVPAAIGIFTEFGISFGPAVAQNISNGAAQLNQLTSPALPGQYVTLWTTGLGGFRTPNVIISLADETFRPSFAGPAPGLPGVDQINFVVPADASVGCYIPVTVTAGNTTSNSATLSVAAASRACVHPLRLTAEQLQTLDQGGAIFVGSINFNAVVNSLGPSMAGDTRAENFNADFRPRGAEEIFLLSPEFEMNSVAISSCSLSGPASAVINAIANANGNVAGPSITLTGPSNQTADVPASILGYQFSPPSPPAAATAADLPPPFFGPGPWQVTAPGGDTVGPFQQVYTLPPQVRWTNRESLTTFTRDRDLPIIWNPQGYAADDVISVLLSSGSTGMFCTAGAQEGSLALPASLLEQVATGTGFLQLNIGSRQRLLFNLPLTGGGTAIGLVSYSFNDVLAVTIQ
jgi:uncharacterized protein (TIGR03437 family)